MGGTGIPTRVFISEHLFVRTSSCIVEVNSESLGAANEKGRIFCEVLLY